MDTLKVGRNERCPCGSGEKFKRCHGRLGNRYQPDVGGGAPFPGVLEAREQIRREQQGLGRPIVSTEVAGRKVVAVGNRLHWSDGWKTFPDFLNGYLKDRLGAPWGNAEIAKPLTERHPVMQWYDALCRHQRRSIAQPGQLSDMEVNGVVACWLTVAYGLYLLDHNVELQGRLLARLRDPGNFQGAYYELIVASVFILAGFSLELEDETDGLSKHCEFAAVSPQTGKRYWIEAKMRGVAGELGRTAADGTRSSRPLSSMVKQLNAAFAKPAPDERMIFLDLNAPMPADVGEDNRPAFFEAATQRLKRFEEKELGTNRKAYVFVTNAVYHKDLDAPAQLIAMPFGLGMPDFSRSGFYRLSERFLNDRQHADALRVAESFNRLLAFPSTFDGSLPSVGLNGEQPPVVIGETYCLQGAGSDGEDVVGTVTSATVMEKEMEVMVGVSTATGSFIAREPISERQLADYKAHPDAFFGRVARAPRQVRTPSDLFDFLMDGFKDMRREELLEKLGVRVEGVDQMDVDHLRAVYAEGIVSASGMFEVVDGVMHARAAGARSAADGPAAELAASVSPDAAVVERDPTGKARE